MTNEIKDLEKACRETAEAGSEMLKAHVKAYTRITSSGERVQVKEHDDSRRTGLDYDQMKKQVKQHLEEHKANGFKIVGESHDADGISVDASKADHHHYFLEDDKGNRATVYHHTQGDHLHTVGASTDGSVPYHPTGTKYLLLPEEWAPDLHKSHVRSYTRKDGTAVKEHDDSRIKAIKTIEQAESATNIAVKTGNPQHHQVAAALHRKAGERNPDQKKYHEDLTEKHEAVKAGTEKGQTKATPPYEDSRQAATASPEVQVLVGSATELIGDMIKKPEMSKYKEVIQRKLDALNANPSAKAAHQVISDVRMIAEKVAKETAPRPTRAGKI